MKTADPTSLSTLPEEQATGEIAALYADLRAVLGIPVVNLIYRHIATLPGALAWSWALLRPAYASGAVEAAAGRLVAGLALPPATPLSVAALAAVGVPGADLPVLRRILDTYHRANPMNLVALSALLAVLDGRSAPAEAAARPPALTGSALPAAAVAPLPPMLAVEAMAPDTAALAWELAALGVAGGPGDMPSVWRNLAHWPGYLALALALLRPLEAGGWLAREMDGVRARRDALAAGLSLAPAQAGPPEPAPDVRAALQAVLRRFTDGLIVRMIPLLAVLRQALPA